MGRLILLLALESFVAEVQIVSTPNRSEGQKCTDASVLLLLLSGVFGEMCSMYPSVEFDETYNAKSYVLLLRTVTFLMAKTVGAAVCLSVSLVRLSMYHPSVEVTSSSVCGAQLVLQSAFAFCVRWAQVAWLV